GLEFSEPSSPHVDRLLADLVLPGDLGDRAFIGLPQNHDHLFFGKPNFLHQLLASSAEAIVSSHKRSEKPGQVISRFAQNESNFNELIMEVSHAPTTKRGPLADGRRARPRHGGNKPCRGRRTLAGRHVVDSVLYLPAVPGCA